MKIYCKHCGKYLGEIRDATLRKGVVFICKECSITNDIFNTLFR